jgi:hypothetical protein
MKFIWVHILLIVFGLVAENITGTSSLDYELFDQDTLSSHPLLDANDVQSRENKNSSKLNFIAKATHVYDLASVTSQKSRDSFEFYFPIYSLTRKNQYFLLI